MIRSIFWGVQVVVADGQFPNPSLEFLHGLGAHLRRVARQFESQEGEALPEGRDARLLGAERKAQRLQEPLDRLTRLFRPAFCPAEHDEVIGATALMVRAWRCSFRWDPLSRPWPVLREMLPSPRRRRPGRTSPRRRVSAPFRLCLIGPPYPSGREGRTGTTWDFHRSVLSAIVCRRPRQSSRRSSRRNRVSTQGESFPRLPQEPELGLPPQPRARRLPHYPHLAPSSPPVARRPWLAALAEFE